MEKNELIALCELMDQSFIIPHYQRGYRWEEQEVTELLDDLWAFQKDKDSGEFYCLQPLVLRKNENESYDVLDGQQRLTTLYLLLVYLEEKRKEDNYGQQLFSLDYETRDKCKKFLEERRFSKNEIDSSNIDFYYICKAYQCIDRWFKDEKHRGAKSKLVPILLDKTEKGNRNIKFIRYEVDNETNPIDVFIRLNVGKIPLTDAELTKALLLQSDKYPVEELEFNKMKLFNIASEWDTIETSLQEKAFWFFLNDNSNQKSSHIEFIFDLIAKKINHEKKYFWDKETNTSKLPKRYATFLVFSEYLQDLIENERLSRIKAVENIWSYVISYFECFKDWFEDRTLYHYIGLLISLNKNIRIDSIIGQSKQNSKSAFKNYLEKEIAMIIKVNKKSLDELKYEDQDGKKTDYHSIFNILLLHNVYTTLKSSNEKPRFPFELYKEQAWSLEHIHAQNPQTLTDISKQKEWLLDHIRSLTIANKQDDIKEQDAIIKVIAEMKEMSEQDKIDNKDFENLEQQVYKVTEKYFEFTQNENIHSIKNLCLLDKATNSQLNNSLFDVKREKIKKRELTGYYIPICTRNVFLKAYTSYPASNAYWTEQDRNDYFEDIATTYNFFVNKLEV